MYRSFAKAGLVALFVASATAQSANTCPNPGNTRTILNFTTSTVVNGGTTTIYPPDTTTSFRTVANCNSAASSNSQSSSSSTTSSAVPTVTTSTTVAAATAFSTTTTTGANSTPTVVIFIPGQPTTFTTTKAQENTATTTYTGANGQATVEVDLPCRTPGFRAEFYTNPFRRANEQTPYDNFDPSYFPPSPPLGGAYFYVPTQDFSLNNIKSNDNNALVYNAVPNPARLALNNRTLQIETFIYSPVAQQIRFTSRTDDIAFSYIGNPKAYTGPFTRANADSFSVAGTNGTTGQSSSSGFFTVAAGSFTPFRFINGFDLYTIGVANEYNNAVVGYQFINTATGADPGIRLYAFVCPGDAPDFPYNGQ